MSDTSKIRQTVDDYDAAVKAVEENEDFTPEAKARKIKALGDGALEAWGKERAAVAEALDREQADLEAKARAGRPEAPKDVHAELRAMRAEMQARDVLDTGNAGAIIEAFVRAKEDGDEHAAAVLAKRGPSKMPDLQSRARLEGMIREAE